MKRVERHHWEAAQVWKKMPGNDLEAAKELVRAWNSGLGLEESCTYVKYPATNELPRL